MLSMIKCTNKVVIINYINRAVKKIEVVKSNMNEVIENTTTIVCHKY